VTTWLDPEDLAGSLAAAEAALAASPPGSEHRWVIPVPPDGEPIDLPAGLSIDAGDRSLVLSGGPGTPRLRIAAGDAAPGLVVRGREVAVRGLALDVERGDRWGVALEGTDRSALVGCVVAATGRDVIAVRVTAEELAEVVGVEVDSVHATVGDAVGVVAEAGSVRLHRARILDVRAAGEATGLEAGRADGAPVGAVSVSAVSVSGVSGDTATGVRVRTGAIAAADDASAAPVDEPVVLLDVDVAQVRSREGGAARGIVVAGVGNVDLRGASVRDVEGDTATGVAVLAGGAVLIAGAVVGGVAGGPEGATGVRVEASASPLPVVVEEVHVEGVHAADHADLVTGVDMLAPVSELAPWVGDAIPPGVVTVTGCAVHRVSGTAVRIDAELRDVLVRGVEVYAAARAATLRGERIIVAEATWHRLERGLEVGPCSLTLVSSIVTTVADGPAVVLGAEAEPTLVRATYADPADPAPLLRPLPDGLPYVDPGPAGVPSALREGRALPPSTVDLRLGHGSALHDEAVPSPADPPSRRPHVGAHPPAAAATCDLRDPLEVPSEKEPPRHGPSPVVDRLARDGRGLLGVMQARADAALPGWVPGDAADLTTTLLELVAHRLDRISHRQDAALAEASLASARLRRSIEAHARLADHRPDPGLSATTVVELRIPPSSLVPLGLAVEEPDGSPSPHVRPFTLAADTVVVNPDSTEAPVIVSTESDLVWYDSLADVVLADDVAEGDTFARLRGDLAELRPGRWLVLQPDDPRAESHVVQATLVERGADTTLVWWDPRRPAPIEYPARGRALADGSQAAGRVLANVVPAHHGLRIGHHVQLAAVERDLAEELAGLVPLLDRWSVTEVDEPVEVPLALAALSRVAHGWPFPHAPERTGRVEVAVEVDGEPWRLVDDVAVEPGEVFSVVPSGDGGSTLLLGQPGSFTGRPVHVTVTAARVGVGRQGNVAAHTLTSLLALGPGSTLPPDHLPGPISLDRVRGLLSVDNPVAGIGGRDPDPLERIRREAPWTARRPATAVTAGDYEHLLRDLPEVAGCRARVQELGERRLVRVTMLLADEDTLVPHPSAATERGDVDLVRDAERLRRWGLVRRRLEEIRLLGFDVMLVPPTFVPLDLDVVVDAEPWASAEGVHREVTEAIAGPGGLVDPDVIGLGGDLHTDGILRAVLAVDGVASARVRRLRRLEAGAQDHAVDGTLPIGSEEVAIVRRPYGDGTDGLLTVEVCGGVR
jgi:hypothetical protein